MEAKEEGKKVLLFRSVNRAFVSHCGRKLFSGVTLLFMLRLFNSVKQCYCARLKHLMVVIKR